MSSHSLIYLSLLLHSFFQTIKEYFGSPINNTQSLLSKGKLGVSKNIQFIKYWFKSQGDPCKYGTWPFKVLQVFYLYILYQHNN